jgi:hypothetical protein
MTTLTIEKLADTVGAAIHDVDVHRLLTDDGLPAATLEALDANGVLLFRGRGIDDASQV